MYAQQAGCQKKVGSWLKILHAALAEQVSMRTGGYQSQDFRVIKVIDQKPIRLDMAFPKPGPFPNKLVGAAPFGQWQISCQQAQNLGELRCLRTAFFHTFPIAFEAIGPE